MQSKNSFKALSGLRRAVCGVVTLGLLFSQLPSVPNLPHVVLGLWLLSKTLGLLSMAPGGMLLSWGFGFSTVQHGVGALASWLLTLLLLEPLLRWVERPRRAARATPEVVAPVVEEEVRGKVTRRALLLGGTAAVVGGGITCFGIADRYDTQLDSWALALPDLPPELEGLRVVLMADWHCSRINRPDALRPALQLANATRPDLFLLPGDFTLHSGSYFSEAAELASSLRPRIPGGVLLSWGNHDYWHGVEPGMAQMPRAGCTILTNRALVLNRKRELGESGSGLWLAGLDDLWAGNPDLVGTLSPLPAGEPRLVMAHNPDTAELQHGARVDLMLSGHTHGGQVRIPGLGAPVLPSRYGQKYASGPVQGPHYQVYVNRGLGTSTVPVRLGVPPEVTVFELHRGNAVELRRIRLA